MKNYKRVNLPQAWKVCSLLLRTNKLSSTCLASGTLCIICSLNLARRDGLTGSLCHKPSSDNLVKFIFGFGELSGSLESPELSPPMFVLHIDYASWLSAGPVWLASFSAQAANCQFYSLDLPFNNCAGVQIAVIHQCFNLVKVLRVTYSVEGFLQYLTSPPAHTVTKYNKRAGLRKTARVVNIDEWWPLTR